MNDIEIGYKVVNVKYVDEQAKLLTSLVATKEPWVRIYSTDAWTTGYKGTPLSLFPNRHCAADYQFLMAGINEMWKCEYVPSSINVPDWIPSVAFLMNCEYGVLKFWDLYSRKKWDKFTGEERTFINSNARWELPQNTIFAWQIKLLERM
jgi:hypothetical protein